MDEKVQHIVTLTADLKTGFDPVKLRGLEELRGLELAEQILFRHRLLGPRLQVIQDETFQ